MSREFAGVEQACYDGGASEQPHKDAPASRWKRLTGANHHTRRFSRGS